MKFRIVFVVIALISLISTYAYWTFAVQASGGPVTTFKHPFHKVALNPLSDTCDGDGCDGWVITQTNCLTTQTHHVDQEITIYDSHGTNIGIARSTHSECDAEWDAINFNNSGSGAHNLFVDIARYHKIGSGDDDNTANTWFGSGYVTLNTWYNGSMFGDDYDGVNGDCYAFSISFIDVYGNTISPQLANQCHDT